jgi:hypothetical protein
MTPVTRGNFVEIRKILLEPADRSERLPEDTKRVPLEARIRGILLSEASVGDEVEIETNIGRIVRGTLIDGDPQFKHGFGKPVRELIEISREIRREG